MRTPLSSLPRLRFSSGIALPTIWKLGLVLFAGLLGTVSGSLAAAPANDALSQAQELTGSTGVTPGTTASATVEPGEPLHVTDAGGSVWYRWDGYRWPETGSATNTLTVAATSFTPRLAVYRLNGDTVAFSNLVKVASGTTTTKSASARFRADPGANYLIAVAGSSRSAGSFNLTWKLAPPPGGGVDLVVVPESLKASVVTRSFNDQDCEVLDGCTTPGNNRLLTIDFQVANRGTKDLILGNPEESPYGVQRNCSRNKVFSGLHRYVLKNSKGQIVKSTEPAEHCLRDDRRENSKSATNQLYTCSGTQGLQAGWLYESPALLPCHFLDISDVASGTYTLEVVTDPHNSIVESNETNNTARITVTIPADCTTPPLNDLRSNAIELQGAIAAILGNSECATVELGEAPHVSGATPGRSIWYRWTAPYTGQVDVSTEGSNFDTLLEIQAAAASGVNGESIASNDDLGAGIPQSRVTFNATQGETYWIVIDGYNLQGGGAKLSINGAVNDSFQDAQPLSGLTGLVTGDNTRATKETGEPVVGGNAGGHSVWYRWTAPIKGPVNLSTEGSTFKTLLGVFQGSAVNKLTATPGTASQTTGGQAKLRFQANAGQTYYFVVDGRAGASGVYQLSWLEEGALPAPLQIAATQPTDGQILLSISGNVGQVVTIQRAIELGAWTNIGTLTLTTTNQARFTNSPGSLNKAFYRAVAP
jgi:hypothetical protein